MSTLNFRDPSKDVQSLILGNGVENGEDLILKPVFLMCDPAHYDPRKKTRIEVNGYAENDMCESSADETFDPGLAKQQHANLRQAILSLGGSIVLNPGQAGMLDNVFKADPSLTIATPSYTDDGAISKVTLKTIGSKFYHHARNPEVTQQMGDIQFFRNKMIEDFNIGVSTVETYVDLHGEGTGDNVYDPARDIFWCGFKPKGGAHDPSAGRSDPDFHKLLQARLNMDNRTVPIEVQKPFFHIDTTLAPLPSGHVLVYPGGVTQEGFQTIEAIAGKENLICVDEQDAKNYACNLIVMDDKNLIMPVISAPLKKRIEDIGFSVTEVDLSQYVALSGGGPHCLTNRINQMRSPRDLHNPDTSPA